MIKNVVLVISEFFIHTFYVCLCYPDQLFSGKLKCFYVVFSSDLQYSGKVYKGSCFIQSNVNSFIEFLPCCTLNCIRHGCIVSAADSFVCCGSIGDSEKVTFSENS